MTNCPHFSCPKEAALYEWFAGHGTEPMIKEHAATHRVEDALAVKGALPAGHSKTLFLKEKSGAFTLLTLPGLARADLKGLAKRIGCGRLSFAPPEDMQRILGVAPGEASPLALINDEGRATGRVILDETLAAEPLIWGHPLRNTASWGLPPAALIDFIRAHFGEPIVATAGVTGT